MNHFVFVKKRRQVPTIPGVVRRNGHVVLLPVVGESGLAIELPS